MHTPLFREHKISINVSSSVPAPWNVKNRKFVFTVIVVVVDFVDWWKHWQGVSWGFKEHNQINRITLIARRKHFASYKTDGSIIANKHSSRLPLNSDFKSSIKS